jgi:hypothetical protein
VLLNGTNGVTIELRPLEYEYPQSRDANWWDLNWLNIAGEVRCSEGSWNFTEPCLLTTEAIQLASWLQNAADGVVQPTAPNASGVIWPNPYFVEPNLALGLAATAVDEVVLRVFFSLESAPPWLTSKGPYEFHLECPLSADALRAAAHQWTEELQPFPERTGS